MGNYALTLAAVLALTSLPTFADFNTQDKGLFKETKKVIRCARKLVDRKRGGAQSVEMAGQILEDARLAKSHGEQAMSEVKKKCRSDYRSNGGERSVSRDELIQSYDAIKDQLDPIAANILGNIVAPKAKCRTLGVGTTVALGLALDGGLSFGTCTLSSGRRFRVATVHGGTGAGIGASVHINAAVYEVILSDLEKLFSRSTEITNVLIGSGVSASLPTGLFSEQPSDITVGIGAGAGFAVTSAKLVSVRLLPAFGDYDELAQELLSNP